MRGSQIRAGVPRQVTSNLTTSQSRCRISREPIEMSGRSIEPEGNVERKVDVHGMATQFNRAVSLLTTYTSAQALKQI